MEGITQFDMSTNNSLINGSGKGNFSDASNVLPLDAVQEFATQQNAQAEYGWRDGSVVNVGIKSGTNSLHGTAYAFGRDANATDATNFFSHVITPAEVEQFGGTLGGRVIKDKVFGSPASKACAFTLPIPVKRLSRRASAACPLGAAGCRAPT